MAANNITQLGLIRELFEKNPNRDVPHTEAVDWLTNEWLNRTGAVFRDPDRGIRSLHQKGFLIKVAKGIYRYDPQVAHTRGDLEDFTSKQKQEILKRDDYKCVICGAGKKDGVELHVDHIKPRDKGGKAVIENGQVLCSMHNFRKKNLGQTETGKKMFIGFYEYAKKFNDEDLLKLSTQVLEFYEENGINGHIVWKK
ncbi:MAG: HNH endonuclease [Defluviitaleaceae bacterium]|nr:HNH endonuclease [Defluviitaleaceae bacterium]